jgi:uncharacterized phage-associated protein
MANPEVERLVDDLIRQGRVTETMRAEYVSLIERGLGDHLLRGADYTNKTKQLADERRAFEAQLQAERTRLNEERMKLEQWQGQAQAELNRYRQVDSQLPELTAKIAAYEQKLKDYQIFDEVVVPTVKTTNPTPTPGPTFGNPQQGSGGKFLTIEDANTFGANMLNLMKKVNKIQAQHRRVFGEDLDDDLIEHFTQTGEDPEQYWRVKYAVDNKIQEIAIKNREAEIMKIREEERAKVLNEIARDPGRVVGPQLGGRTHGGLTPLLEAYTQSRAMQHGQNQVPEVTPKGDFIPPERKPELAASRDRVAAAQNMFMKNWDDTGIPITDEGKRLSQRYSSGE